MLFISLMETSLWFREKKAVLAKDKKIQGLEEQVKKQRETIYYTTRVIGYLNKTPTKSVIRTLSLEN